MEKDDEDYKVIERQKVREERLKRNHEKMSSIKNIYETFSTKKKAYKSEKKYFETDVEDRKEKIRIKKEEKPENEFNDMVNRKLAT